MFIYSIFDKKGNVHRSQMVLRDDAEAVRAVARSANNVNSDLFMFCDDFALYRIGQFDVNSGVISPDNPIIFICNVSSLIKIEKNTES